MPTAPKSLYLLILTLLCSSAPAEDAAPPSAEAQFALAEDLRYQRRDYPKAIDAYRKVAQDHPKTEWAARALDMAAFTYFYNLKECDKAVEVYDQLAANYPNTPESDYGLFVAGNLLFRVLQHPELAAQKHCLFLARCRELGVLTDPAVSRAEDQLWRAAQRLCLDPANAAPPKGKLNVQGQVRTKLFGVYFPPGSQYALDYDLTLEAKTFRIQGDKAIGPGFIAVFADDLYEPFRVEADGAPYACHALVEKHMVVAGVEPGQVYAVKGLTHRGKLTVKGSFACEPFKIWFSDQADMAVEVTYDVSGKSKKFAFEFEEMVTDKRGRITMPLKEGETSVRVLEDGRPFDKFRIEGIEKEPPPPKKQRVVEPPKPRKITLVVEEVNPTKTYVVEPAGTTPQDALDETPEKETEDDAP